MFIYVIVLYEYADYKVSNLEAKQYMHFFLHDNWHGPFKPLIIFMAKIDIL